MEGRWCSLIKMKRHMTWRSASIGRRDSCSLRPASMPFPIDVSELSRAMGLLVREDIRFIPVIACAFADEDLKEMFKFFLPDDIPGGKKGMLARFGRSRLCSPASSSPLR